MAKVLDSLTLPIKKNGVVSNETIVNNPLSTAGQFSTSTAYAVGQYVYYDKKLYRFTTAHAAGAWNASHVTEVTVASELADLKEDTTELKQDFNEYHPDLGSGYSAQLLSTVFIEDEVPYNFRTSGGSADIGDREYDEIVGVSMPVNQLINPNTTGGTSGGITFTYNNGTITTSGSYTGSSYVGYNCDIVTPKAIKDHLYYVSGCAGGGAENKFRIWVNSNAAFPLGKRLFDVGGGAMRKAETDENLGHIEIQIFQNAGDVSGLKFTPQFFDLTLMLGTAIADYVLSLETATAGSGVTWLRHHLPKIFDSGYIPYNAGEMQSVSGLSAHRMTGFNQWDEEWEVGSYGGNGAPVTSATNLRSKSTDYIPVFPSTTYYFTALSGSAIKREVFYFDENKQFITFVLMNGDGTFTTPKKCVFIRFGMHGAYGAVYKNDICINLHWDGERDGEYEEYKEYEYALDDSVVLRGKLELDSNNNLRANGDRYLPDGTLERRWRETNMADLTWNYDPSSYRWQTTTLSTVIKNYPSRSANLVSDKWVADILAANGDNGKMFTGSGYVFCYSTDSVNKPTGTLLFELATPTTETAEPYQTPQIVDDWGTEEYVSTSLVPVGHDTKYANNLRAKLEMSPDSPEEDGDYIVRHNNGENEYVALGSTTTIQGILDRLTALENA